MDCMSAKQTYLENYNWIRLSNIVKNVGHSFCSKNRGVMLPICKQKASGNLFQSRKELSSLFRYDSKEDKCMEIWKLDNPIECWIITYTVDIENE